MTFLILTDEFNLYLSGCCSLTECVHPPAVCPQRSDAADQGGYLQNKNKNSINPNLVAVVHLSAKERWPNERIRRLAKSLQMTYLLSTDELWTHFYIYVDIRDSALILGACL